MNEDEEKMRYKYFLKERTRIVDDIRQFLSMVLSYFVNMEERIRFLQDPSSTLKELGPLIKSLCLIHGLYGYPKDIDETVDRTQFVFISAVQEKIDSIIGDLKKQNKQTDVQKLATEVKELFCDQFMDRNAVKNILLNEVEINEKKFVDYCENLADENGDFWQFKFDNLKSLPREPAYMFLNMVRSQCLNNDKEASIIGRTFLKALPDNNSLKPKTWAQHKTDPKLFGVSLGVRSFVRPLFLFIKLTQLSTNEVPCVKLKDVNAFTMTKNEVKPPSTTCQISLGTESTDFPLGNCAEYDLVGVQQNLKDTKEWKHFESACQQHLDAFKEMEKQTSSSAKIFKTYFKETREPRKPAVLKYRMVPDGKEMSTSFELYATEDWPEPKK